MTNLPLEPFDPLAEADEAMNALATWLADVPGGVCIFWPSPTSPAALTSFPTIDAWRRALEALDLDSACAAPAVVRVKYRRAQKLYLLAWADADVMLAAEIVAFTALELALNDRFGLLVKALSPPRKKKEPSATGMIATPPLSDLLDHLVTHQGIRELDFPTALIGGGRVINRLRKIGPLADRPTLAEMRNRHAHGSPIEGGPLSGLLHVIRDLIHYCYA
ncbi:hypothetical protein [Caulobacter sp. RHG1]|uniref:hypothetical protein n=1 Tax=Caulobacter sp. (strain RHG1) TaxID=2545762 RepID=UPI001554E2EA|nr:hypothetical protein [Caulobacter sp. RHG1]NQE65307.1 hypothetical protein [Caulobacter sp. RHG1]